MDTLATHSSTTTALIMTKRFSRLSLNTNTLERPVENYLTYIYTSYGSLQRISGIDNGSVNFTCCQPSYANNIYSIFCNFLSKRQSKEEIIMLFVSCRQGDHAGKCREIARERSRTRAEQMDPMKPPSWPWKNC